MQVALSTLSAISRYTTIFCYDLPALGEDTKGILHKAMGSGEEIVEDLSALLKLATWIGSKEVNLLWEALVSHHNKGTASLVDCKSDRRS